MRDAIIAGLLLGMAHGAAQAATVVPNFTTGTVTSETTSRTEVIEVIRQQEFSTSNSYTVTGTNITVPGRPSLGTPYRMHTQGETFQFSETTFSPGLVRDTLIERTTTTDATTITTSVFTQ